MSKTLQALCAFAIAAVATSCAHAPRSGSGQPATLVGNAVGAQAAQVATPLEQQQPLTDGPATKNDLSDSGADMRMVPHEVNLLVLQWIDYFQGRGREHMERYLSRSGQYLPIMKEILHKEGLPEDLVFIALIESGFTSHARSHANAVGFWQFIRGTGRRYGLRVDSYVDERRDFVRATYAAADYLKGLYNLFGSWYLAIASYNVGENRIKNLVMRYHTRDFWQLAREGKLPQETINYVPKFLAARMIAKEPEKYGFTEVEYLKPIQFEEIEIAGSVDMRAMAKEMGIDYEQLSALNPAFKRGVAVQFGNRLKLRVPQGSSQKALLAASVAMVQSGRVAQIARLQADDEYTLYRVRKGDNLNSIARRFRTTTRAIRELNGFRASSRIIAGRRIKVPGSEGVAGLARRQSTAVSSRRASAGAARAARAVAASARAAKRIHIVRRGDTLVDIAQKYQVSLQELASYNRISRRSRIGIGTRLEIP